jgi:hypothetical protein
MKSCLDARRAVAMGVLILLGVMVLAGVAGIVVAAVEKAPNDTTGAIERVLMPAITGLIGVLGGLFATSTSR